MSAVDSVEIPGKPSPVPGIQILLHIYRYIKESSYKLAHDTVVYSCSCTYLTRRLQALQPGRTESESWSQKSIVKKLTYSQYHLVWVLLTVCFLCHQPSMACTDIRGQLSEFNCLDYDPESSTFSMTCSFSWTYNITKCIVLQKNERFEGNGHSINLTGVTNWEGLFRIATNESSRPSSLRDAPLIHDVHMIGGETSPQGGFVIQSEQQHFIVNSCSSTGVIQGINDYPMYIGGGGICGHGCSGDILITHCWSTGEMHGRSTGGIAGREIGLNGDTDNTVTISHCYSTGDLVGEYSGGICGFRVGHNNKGMVIIKQCYSLGEIGGHGSGGITGADAGHGYGHVFITDCYSRGDITGANHAGGICGAHMGHVGGTVILTNVYSSGKVVHNAAGSLIGSIHSDATQINISMSVYNGGAGLMIRGSIDAHSKEKNSDDLGGITGTVYCYNGDNGGDQSAHTEYCWNNETVWQAVKNDFPILVDKTAEAAVTPTGTPSSHPTSSISHIPKETQTATPTPTSTGSNTETRTPSASTATVATTDSQTGSLTPSLTSSETRTASRTMSGVSSTSSHSGTSKRRGTASPSPTKTLTSTGTASPSGTITNTPKETPSLSATPTNIRNREQMELPVQYPIRSVIMKNGDKKTNKTKRA